MSGNTIGKLFTVTSFGESHGPAIGCIVDGCPPGLNLTEADLQEDLDRRKPGTSRHTTQRREADDHARAEPAHRHQDDGGMEHGGRHGVVGQRVQREDRGHGDAHGRQDQGPGPMGKAAQSGGHGVQGKGMDCQLPILIQEGAAPECKLYPNRTILARPKTRDTEEGTPRTEGVVPLPRSERGGSRAAAQGVHNTGRRPTLSCSSTVALASSVSASSDPR
mgnify:CR=1 FL=1